jgi:hypothetical protein
MFGFRESMTIERKPEQVCVCTKRGLSHNNSILGSIFVMYFFKCRSSQIIFISICFAKVRVNHFNYRIDSHILYRSAYEYWTHGSSLMDVVDKLTPHSDLVINEMLLI